MKRLILLGAVILPLLTYSQTSKTTIKNYFLTGSKPTQTQYHTLIDNCYNGVTPDILNGVGYPLISFYPYTTRALTGDSGYFYYGLSPDSGTLAWQAIRMGRPLNINGRLKTMDLKMESYNIYLGFLSGIHRNNGNYNSFIGYSSGRANTNGSNNTFIGTFTGNANTIGNWNTFIGESSGINNISGDSNVYVGRGTGYNSTTGNHNTYVGLAAGGVNSNGSNNIFLGYGAGAYETHSNKLYIANSATSTPLIFGSMPNDTLILNANVLRKYSKTVVDSNLATWGYVDAHGVDTTLLQQNTDTMTWDATQYWTNNRLLIDTCSVNGAGEMYINSDKNIWVITTINDDLETIIGGTVNQNAIKLIFISQLGQEIVSTGNINLDLIIPKEYYELELEYNDGTDMWDRINEGVTEEYVNNKVKWNDSVNIYIGDFAGYQNTGGYQSAFGISAGQENTGSYQSAFGYASGYQNTGQNQSTFGHEAGIGNIGDYQSSFGYTSGQLNTGDYQSSFGFYAGNENTGNNEIAIGMLAGTLNSGDNCIFIGDSTGRNNSKSRRIFIGTKYGADSTKVLFFGRDAGDRQVTINGDLNIAKTSARLTINGQIKQIDFHGNLTDGIPTTVELNAATGLTPSGVGAGFFGFVKDDNGSGLTYGIHSDGTTWDYWITTKSL